MYVKRICFLVWKSKQTSNCALYATGQRVDRARQGTVWMPGCPSDVAAIRPASGGSGGGKLSPLPLQIRNATSIPIAKDVAEVIIKLIAILRSEIYHLALCIH